MSHSVFFLTLSIVFDVAANVLLKYSNGFRRKGYGFFAIVLIVAAFASLVETIKAMDLSIAYAVWGGLGLVATSFCDAVLFGQKIKRLAWLGIFFITFGVAMLNLA